MAYPTTFMSNYNFAVNFQNRLNEITTTTIRNRVLLTMMQSLGRIMPADGGELLEWIVYMRNPKPRGYSGEGVPEYNAPDSFRTARLPWGSYHHGLKLDRIKIQTNKGKQAFINVISQSIQEVSDSFTNRWPEYFYQDGDNPPGGEARPLIGFYTWLGKYSTNTAAAYQGYQGKVRIVSGSYAGITMDLGTESSEWAGDDGYDTVQAGSATLGTTTGQKWWPHGQGDSAYDFFHPLVVKTASASWGSNPAFDEVYCEKMLDFGIMYSRRNSKGDKGPINLIISATTPMLSIRNRFAATYRTMSEIIPSDPGRGNGPGMGPGSAYGKPIYQFNGCYLVDDYDMPNSSDLIGLNLQTISYRPVHPYNQTTGQTPIMEPYEGEIPGGGGKLLGGFNLGQLQIDTPRNSVLWSPLV